MLTYTESCPPSSTLIPSAQQYSSPVKYAARADLQALGYVPSLERITGGPFSLSKFSYFSAWLQHPVPFQTFPVNSLPLLSENLPRKPFSSLSYPCVCYTHCILIIWSFAHLLQKPWILLCYRIWVCFCSCSAQLSVFDMNHEKFSLKEC